MNTYYNIYILRGKNLKFILKKWDIHLNFALKLLYFTHGGITYALKFAIGNTFPNE